MKGFRLSTTMFQQLLDNYAKNDEPTKKAILMEKTVLLRNAVNPFLQDLAILENAVFAVACSHDMTPGYSPFDDVNTDFKSGRKVKTGLDYLWRFITHVEVELEKQDQHEEALKLHAELEAFKVKALEICRMMEKVDNFVHDQSVKEGAPGGQFEGFLRGLLKQMSEST